MILADLIQSFLEVIEEFGFAMLLAAHRCDLPCEYRLTRKMLEHRVDGMALVATEHRDETLSLLSTQDMPTVLLWNYCADAPFPCVRSDSFHAGRMVGNMWRRLATGRSAAPRGT